MALATRDGVLSRPSLSASSPTSSSSRRIRSSNSLLSFVFDIVVLGLPQHQLLQLSRADARDKNLPERGNDVLRSRNHTLHEGHVEVEVLVVDDVDDLTLDYFLELRQVADVAGLRIDLAFDRDVECVVVSVPVGIVALPEQPRVLGFGQLGIMNAMGGVEPQAAGDCYARHV